jgi:hypothetical protein
VAYPILESAGALAKTRIRDSRIADLGAPEVAPPAFTPRSPTAETRHA